MGKENSFSYQPELHTGSIKGTVSGTVVRPELTLEYLSETDQDERFQTLPLPSFFSTFQEMSERKLSISWKNGQPSIEAYSQLLEGLSTYISLKYPGFWIITPIKNYAERAHGQPDRSTHQLVPVVHFLNEIEENAAVLNQTDREKWTGSVSNVVIITAEPHYSYQYGEIPKLPQNDYVPQMMIFPVLDLDIDSSGNPQADLAEVGKKLAKYGFSGSLIQSGDPPNGGYHYLADFVMPYDPFMWQSLGKLMTILTSPNDKELLDLSATIENAESLEDAQRATQKILGMKKIRTRSYPFSLADLRFCVHQVDVGMSNLRVLRGKNYNNPPTIVASIRE